ncbi:MAG: pirin family protein [Rhodothalassiaceae bacterium]
MRARRIARQVAPVLVSDGAGVRIRRLIGTPELDQVDPFLLFDAFGSDRGSDYIGGFPPHPHRGFETVTYMLAGHMRHEDNQGHMGILGPGDVQWMTAGRGIVHSEMPAQQDGLMRGFQIWVNLPKSHKMTAPRYQEIPAADIPTIAVEPGAKVRLIAGRFGNVTGPVRDIIAEPLYLDIRLAPGATLEIPTAAGHNGIVHVYEGRVRVGGDALPAGHLAVLEDGTSVHVAADAGGEAEAGLLLLAAKPFREPVLRHGPFVMNSREEILEAIEDYRAGRF